MDATYKFIEYFDADRLRLILFLIGCIATLFFWKDRQGKKLRRYIVLPSIVLLAVFLNPFVASKLQDGSDGAQSLRFFWIIPTTLLVAILVVRMFAALPKKRVLVLLIPAAMIFVFRYADGLERIRGQWNGQAENWYKVPNLVVELCDQIMEDDAGVDKRAIFPLPLSLWVRQYQPGIQTLYAWSWDSSTFTPERYDLYFTCRPQEACRYYGTEYLGTPVYLKDVATKAIQQNYPYIILPAQQDGYEGDLRDYGYEEIFRVNTNLTKRDTTYDQEYVLYRTTLTAGTEVAD